jgi:hypothetical protein
MWATLNFKIAGLSMKQVQQRGTVYFLNVGQIKMRTQAAFDCGLDELIHVSQVAAE